MILDAQLLFGASVDCGSISSGSSLSLTDVLDLGAHLDAWGSSDPTDLGESGDIWLHMICEDEAFTAAGNTTLTVTLKTHTSATGIASGSTVLTKTISITGSGATGPADGSWLISQPIPRKQLKRYLAVNVANSGANMSAGKVTCWIGGNAETPKTSQTYL